MKRYIFTIAIAALSAVMALAATASETGRIARPTNVSAERILPPPLQQRLAPLADQLELQAKDAYWNQRYRQAIMKYHLLDKAGRCQYDDLYNLACCYARIGNAVNAAKYLLLSVQAGFNDIGHLQADPDFDAVRESPCFRSAVDAIIGTRQTANR
jgi:hypothetical protein